MSSQLKRKYRITRTEFKRELLAAAEENHALAMLMVETFTASHHRTHIMKTWELLGRHHPVAYRHYCDKLMGKHLSGKDDVWNSLHFAGYKELREKYIYKIPNTWAMGDALAVAYRVLRKSA